MATLLAVDPGATSAKRVARGADGRAAVLPDAATGTLRAGPVGGGTTQERAAACLAWARREVPDLGGLAVLAQDDAEAQALGAALGRLAPDLVTAALPAAVAAALLASGDAPPADGDVDAVLDLGHSAARLSLVRWHAVGGEVFPALEGDAATAPGGAALDARLRRAATGARDAPAFHELKELFRARGPWVRAWGGAQVRLEARAGASATGEWLAELEAALADAAGRARAAGARRVVVTGGLQHLPPVEAVVRRALAPLPLLPLPDPVFAAGRGGLLALERPARPRAGAALSLVVRTPAGVEAREVVARGEPLPGRFGPLRVRIHGSDVRGSEVAGGEVVVRALEGDAVLEARLTLPAGTVELHASWRYGRGWALEHAGGAAPLVAAPAEVARAVRDALTFDWGAHSQPVPLDLVFVYRATQGGGEAAARVTRDAVAQLASAAIAHNPDVRLRAIAVGDHPQGHLRPAYVTLRQPAWTPLVDELARWTDERLRQPVDGIDAAEAYECALHDAVGLDWRGDATRVLVLLADAPAHTPDAPPYCPVDWRAEVARLGAMGVRVVPVHVATGGISPTLRRQTLAFLEGVGPVLTLRSGAPGPDLLGAVTAAASARRMDPRARAVVEGVALELAS